MRRLKWLVVVWLILPLLYGCGSKEPARKPAGKAVKIAVSVADMERDGNQTIKKTLTACKEGVDITWLDAKNDPQRQEKDLDELAKKEIKAVILQVVDPVDGSGLIRRLSRNGIKVVALETLPPDVPVDGYVASDHATAGELQARYLLQLAQSRGAPVKTVVLQGDKNDQAAIDIVSSIKGVLQNRPEVQMAVVKAHPRGDPVLARATMEQVLEASSSRIDAVLATDSRLAGAAVEVLKERGLAGRVVTVGAGADKQAYKYLASGDHDAEVDLRPDLLGQYACDAAVGLATTGYWQYDRQVKSGNFSVPAKITPVRLITAKDLYLLEERWGKAGGGDQKQNGKGDKGRSEKDDQKNGQGDEGNSDEKKDNNGGEDKSEAGKEQGGKNAAGKRTTLKITTKEGKTVEVQIDGEVKKIESTEGGKGGKKDGGRSEGTAGR
jgi:ABC-type sugar transport system substrate-binding protein